MTEASLTPILGELEEANGEIEVRAGLGPAAERFTNVMLRKSAETQRTYRLVYERFTRWLIERTGQANPPLEAFTADALSAYLDHLEQTLAPATVRKDRAALNRLAKYLQMIGAVDATEILMVETVKVDESDQIRDALTEEEWARVKAVARSRFVKSPSARISRVTATRDLALILLLGELGLRAGEVRALTTDAVGPLRKSSSRPWLKIHGKGSKTRKLPIPQEVSDALLEWERIRPRGLDRESLLFPRLGRQRVDGSFPDAGGRLSETAVLKIVKPVMLAAGVEPERAHPHVLRHTFGTLYMRRGGEVTALQKLMGHAKTDTTAVYIHHTHESLQAAMDEHVAGASVLERDAERRRRRKNRA